MIGRKDEPSMKPPTKDDFMEIEGKYYVKNTTVHGPMILTETEYLRATAAKKFLDDDSEWLFFTDVKHV